MLLTFECFFAYIIYKYIFYLLLKFFLLKFQYFQVSHLLLDIQVFLRKSVKMLYFFINVFVWYETFPT